MADSVNIMYRQNEDRQSRRFGLEVFVCGTEYGLVHGIEMICGDVDAVWDGDDDELIMQEIASSEAKERWA